MDIPNSGAIFTLGKSHLAENTQSYFYIKNDPVKRLISGPHQSAVICESGRLFVWGENHYGQLGIGGSNNNNNNNGDTVTKPTCVKSLKTLGLKISDIAFGNDWAVILTQSNELFFTGRNIFADDANVARNFTEATVANEQCSIIRKPFRLEEFDDCLSKSEEAENFVGVLAGNEHFAVMTSFGRLIGWGSNLNYKLGTTDATAVLRPYEIKLDAPVQQFCCGPESTLVLTESENLYLTGRLNEFVFPQFTILQKNLAATEQIIFMNISKASEIYIVTNAGSIYRSIESLRNKNLIFQRFYDYDSEENGPIWKLLKGSSFYTVLTKANKFYTTFSESGHHLKTFREISKFKNLRLLDMAVGDKHILVHGIPRSSTLSATVGPAREPRLLSRSFVMATAPEISGGSAKKSRPAPIVAVTKILEHQLDTNGNSDADETASQASAKAETPKPNTPMHATEDSNGSETETPIATAEDNPPAIEMIAEVENESPNESPIQPKSPTASLVSRKSQVTPQINKAEQSAAKGTSEKLLRPRTPYPESSTASTPQTIKKTPLRNFSYEAAMDHDFIEHTSPALLDSLENIPESVADDRAPITATIGTPTPPTPPIEEDEELTVEINTTTDALDQTVVVNEIRFINNGIDVTANVEQQHTLDSQENSVEEAEEARKEGEDILDSLEQEIEEKMEQAHTLKDDMEKHAMKKSDTFAEQVEAKMHGARESVEAKMHGARESVEASAKKAMDGARDAVDTVGENVKRVANESRQAVETAGNNALKMADGAKHTVGNAVGNALFRMADNTKLAVDTVTTKISNEMHDAKESLTAMMHGKNNKVGAEDEDASSEAASKEGGAKTSSTAVEDDERTTASVNSNHTSNGNPFEGANPFEIEGTNPFENDTEDTVDRAKRDLRQELQQTEHSIKQQAEQGKGRMAQFLSDIRAKGKGMSCRNEKSIRIEDEPPGYSLEDELTSSRNGHNTAEPAGPAVHRNTSKVCSIL